MIKSVSQDNLSKIIELRVRLFEDAGKISSVKEKEDLLEINTGYFTRHLNRNELFGYYEELDGEIISIALATLFAYPPINHENQGYRAYIFNVYTHEAYRNQGKASQILKVLIDDLKNQGVTRFSLDANEMSMKIYEKLGFKLKDKHMVLEIK